MRISTFLLTLVALSSCHNKELFSALYLQQFRMNNNTSIEFIDSTICVVLTRTDTIDGIAKAAWRIENRIGGTFLFTNIVVDSFGMKLEQLSDTRIKFKTRDNDLEFQKIRNTDLRPDITGVWKCLSCDSLPPYKSDAPWRRPTYQFGLDKHFKIEEDDFAIKGTWAFSPSGRLILLNKLHKSGDLILGDVLIVHKVTDNELTISLKNTMGTIVPRKLTRVKT